MNDEEGLILAEDLWNIGKELDAIVDDEADDVQFIQSRVASVADRLWGVQDTLRSMSGGSTERMFHKGRNR